MENSISILNKISFSDLVNWSVQYLVDNEFSYNEDYELVAIGEFLIRSRKSIQIKDEIEYRRVTVSSKNGGVKTRDIVRGNTIGTKKQYLIEPNQFLMSKIDARNGAFGIVPKELNGAIVTNDFPSFIVDEKIINIQFLVLIATTQKFLEFAQSCSSGRECNLNSVRFIFSPFQNLSDFSSDGFWNAPPRQRHSPWGLA